MSQTISFSGSAKAKGTKNGSGHIPNTEQDYGRRFKSLGASECADTWRKSTETFLTSNKRVIKRIESPMIPTSIVESFREFEAELHAERTSSQELFFFCFQFTLTTPS